MDGKGGSSLKLPRKKILRGKKNFDALFSQGDTLHGKKVNMRFRIFNNTNPECKMAFIAATRLGNAVKRNTMKRRMREAFRLHQHIVTDAIQDSGFSLHGALMAKHCGVCYQRIELDVISLLEQLKKTLLKKRNT